MNIRRPVAAFFVALALVGGPATLTACGADPSGINRNDGDSSDNETGNTSGGDPGGTSQGNVPKNDDGTGTGSRDNGEDPAQGG
jgi:hypothetical protein